MIRKFATALLAAVTVMASIALIWPDVAQARRLLAGGLDVSTPGDPVEDPNDENYLLYTIEVVNNTGETVKDIHIDPKTGQPSGTAQQPPTDAGTGSPLPGTWSAGTGGGSYNWGSTDGGLADGGTGFFVIRVRKNFPRESNSDATATSDGDLNPDSPIEGAEDEVSGIPAKA